MSSKFKKSPFNLIEIMCSLVVIAFGVAAAMAILQPSIRASRDSVSDNYCADGATQFMAYVETEARKNWSSFVGTDSAFSYSPPASYPSIDSGDMETPSGWGPSDAATRAECGNIYYTGGNLSKASGVYGVKCGSDFAANVKLWKQEISDLNGLALSKSRGVRFHIEISYPAEKPYSARDKKYYSLEVFNQ